jgi:hypothetical protein
MPRERYTYKAAWSAEAAKGDFQKMADLRTAIKRKTFTTPTERVIVATIVQHLFETKSAKDLATLYAEAHAIAVEEKKKRDAAERKKKEADLIKKLEAQLRELKGK